MNDGPGVFVVFGLLLMVGVTSCTIGERCQVWHWQEECVKRKVAHWEVATDGKTKFVWDAQASEQEQEQEQEQDKE